MVGCPYGSERSPSGGASNTDIVRIGYTDIQKALTVDDRVGVFVPTPGGKGYQVDIPYLVTGIKNNPHLYGDMYTENVDNFCGQPPPESFPGANSTFAPAMAMIARAQWNKYCQCKLPPVTPGCQAWGGLGQCENVAYRFLAYWDLTLRFGSNPTEYVYEKGISFGSCYNGSGDVFGAISPLTVLSGGGADGVVVQMKAHNPNGSERIFRYVWAGA